MMQLWPNSECNKATPQRVQMANNQNHQTIDVAQSRGEGAGIENHGRTFSILWTLNS